MVKYRVLSKTGNFGVLSFTRVRRRPSCCGAPKRSPAPSAWQLQNQVFLDAKYLGVDTKKKVYGMFTRFFDLAGREDYNLLSDREKRTQTTVPDLVTSHHPPGSALAVSGPQI